MAQLRKLGENRNWKFWEYVDNRGTRHVDPYHVLVLEPIDPNKTSPTYGDIFMFVEQMLRIEAINDKNLHRAPELPKKLDRLLEIIYKYVQGDVLEARVANG